MLNPDWRKNRFYAAPTYRNQAIELTIWSTDKDTENQLLGKSVEFEEHIAPMVSEPTLICDKRAAQELMDQLWQCGIRPTDGVDNAGALAATKDHLKDMQKIVFDLLECRFPDSGAQRLDERLEEVLR